MDSKKVTYFLSDLHLGATYLEDPRGNEARVARFLDSIVLAGRYTRLLV